MKRQRYTAVGQLLLFAAFLGPALLAYFVWHWPIGRVLFLAGFAFFLFIASLFMLGSLLDEIARRRRTKVMIAAARRLNMTCYPGQFHRDMLPEEAWGSLLLRSTDNDVRNLLHGTAQNIDIKIFDAYVNIAVNSEMPRPADRGTRLEVQRLEQTVACVTSPTLQLPRFSLLRATWEDGHGGLSDKVSSIGLGALLSGEEAESRVTLKESQVFSARNELFSDDPKAAEGLFQAPVVSFLESELDLQVCGRGHVLLFFRESQLANVDDAKRLLDMSLRLAKLFSSGYHHSA